jgi:molecular chaperone GrpE (heat shock protein)
MVGFRLEEQIAQNKETATNIDADISNVENRKPLEVNEINDLAMQPRVTTKKSVDDVAHGTTNDQPNRNDGHLAFRLTKREHHANDDDCGNHANDWP